MKTCSISLELNGGAVLLKTIFVGDEHLRRHCYSGKSQCHCHDIQMILQMACRITCQKISLDK